MHTSSTNISCTFTYDQFGNPLSYYNGKRHTMTWRNGRELNSVTVGGKTYSYEYDVNGLRTRKTNADGTYSDYYWMESMLLAEVQYAANGAFIRTLKFLYDENNTVVGISVKNAGETSFTSYYYAKNLQGDVVAVYRSDYNSTTQTYYPTLVASYEYDAWGKVIAVKGSAGTVLSLDAYPNHIAHVNPIRYRGYYYDTETGFYYLQSRYYDPVISRFINADSYGSTGQDFLGTNMFAYCANNPVDRVDYAGKSWRKAEEFSKQADKYSYPVEFLLECTTLGSTLQYKVTYTKKGGMYEHWYDENGVEVWTRHHSDHGNPTKHPIVPHDHEWFDDENGNHKPGPGQKPNPAFQAPTEGKNNSNKFAIATGAIGGAAIGYGVYVIAKWAVAIFAAPATGGASIAIAGATP